MGEALCAELGSAPTAALFGRAGIEVYLRDPPQHMVDETQVTRLHAVLNAQLAPDQARRIGRDAGARTGTYLLENRIPRPVQRLLRILPAPLASRLLVAAIGRHAWTFAGTARFRAHGARPVWFRLDACPLCRGAVASTPCCDFYAGCFERLFRALVAPTARVTETACAAAGAPACRFEVLW
jgi:divinyl protochlorophyllide a 8-vinyl-reductase